MIGNVLITIVMLLEKLSCFVFQKGISNTSYGIVKLKDLDSGIER